MSEQMSPDLHQMQQENMQRLGDAMRQATEEHAAKLEAQYVDAAISGQEAEHPLHTADVQALRAAPNADKTAAQDATKEIETLQARLDSGLLRSAEAASAREDIANLQGIRGEYEASAQQHSDDLRDLINAEAEHQVGERFSDTDSFWGQDQKNNDSNPNHPVEPTIADSGDDWTVEKRRGELSRLIDENQQAILNGDSDEKIGNLNAQIRALGESLPESERNALATAASSVGNRESVNPTAPPAGGEVDEPRTPEDIRGDLRSLGSRIAEARQAGASEEDLKNLGIEARELIGEASRAENWGRGSELVRNLMVQQAVQDAEQGMGHDREPLMLPDYIDTEEKEEQIRNDLNLMQHQVAISARAFHEEGNVEASKMDIEEANRLLRLRAELGGWDEERFKEERDKLVSQLGGVNPNEQGGDQTPNPDDTAEHPNPNDPESQPSIRQRLKQRFDNARKRAGYASKGMLGAATQPRTELEGGDPNKKDALKRRIIGTVLGATAVATGVFLITKRIDINPWDNDISSTIDVNPFNGDNNEVPQYALGEHAKGDVPHIDGDATSYEVFRGRDVGHGTLNNIFDNPDDFLSMTQKATEIHDLTGKGYDEIGQDMVRYFEGLN